MYSAFGALSGIAFVTTVAVLSFHFIHTSARGGTLCSHYTKNQMDSLIKDEDFGSFFSAERDGLVYEVMFNGEGNAILVSYDKPPGVRVSENVQHFCIVDRWNKMSVDDDAIKALYQIFKKQKSEP
jgi:hypothetical protein